MGKFRDVIELSLALPLIAAMPAAAENASAYTKIDLDAYKAVARLSIVEIVNAAVFDWIARQDFANAYRKRFGEPPPEGYLEEALADWMEKRQAAKDFGKA